MMKYILLINQLIKKHMLKLIGIFVQYLLNKNNQNY